MRRKPSLLVDKIAWLAKHMKRLTIAGMLYRNDQACYGCAAVAIPEDLAKNRFRLVSDYRAIND